MQSQTIGFTILAVAGYGQVQIILSKVMIPNLTSIHLVLGDGSTSTQQMAFMTMKQTEVQVPI